MKTTSTNVSTESRSRGRRRSATRSSYANARQRQDITVPDSMSSFLATRRTAPVTASSSSFHQLVGDVVFDLPRRDATTDRDDDGLSGLDDVLSIIDEVLDIIDTDVTKMKSNYNESMQ